jgi:hypothetical protein
MLEARRLRESRHFQHLSDLQSNVCFGVCLTHASVLHTQLNVPKTDYVLIPPPGILEGFARQAILREVREAFSQDQISAQCAQEGLRKPQSVSELYPNDHNISSFRLLVSDI